MKTGSISLATVREIVGVTPQRSEFTIQLLSANLSADTTVNLQLSLDKTNWDNAVESGSDIALTLSDDVPLVRSFAVDAGIYFKVLFAGATTGTVAYKHTGL